MKPIEMTIFQLVDLLAHDKAAALKEMTLRFRRATREASDRARALGLAAYDGRAGEPLPPEENWEGIPVGRARRLADSVSTEPSVQLPTKTADEDGACKGEGSQVCGRAK